MIRAVRLCSAAVSFVIPSATRNLSSSACDKKERFLTSWTSFGMTNLAFDRSKNVGAPTFYVARRSSARRFEVFPALRAGLTVFRAYGAQHFAMLILALAGGANVCRACGTG